MASDPAEQFTPLTETSEGLTPDSPVYQPPANAEHTDELDASVDGTSAAHYGANDPALYEPGEAEQQ